VPTDDPAAGGLPIHRVSELLAVPAATLRSWERRYGLPTTPRSAGGHRRYTEEEVRQLRLMRDETARGRRAADAARAVRVLLDQSVPTRGRVEAFLAAAERMQPDEVRAVLEQANAELGLAATLDEVLMPGMRQIGSWWETGRCDVGQEHLTTEIARSWLSRRISLAPAPRPGPPVLLACGPRDLHTLGLESFATLLAHEGQAFRLLGARTPERTLVTAITATSAGAVVLVSHLATQRRPAVEALRAAEATRACPVFYAGSAFVFAGAREGVPGTYLGERLAEAAQMVMTAVGD
jgi:DNA-binding transcriptional MerR regulator